MTAACPRCQTTMYTEWWNESAGRYECRRCATVNQGGLPARTPTHLILGLWLAVAVLLAADLVVALAVFVLSSDSLWRMAAAVALGAVVPISVVYVIAMIVVALRGRLSGR